jgi:hypothetical protein
VAKLADASDLGSDGVIVPSPRPCSGSRESGNDERRQRGKAEHWGAELEVVTAMPSAPVLRPVPDVQDFDNFFGGTVHDDVRRANEFAGSLDLSGSPKAGKVASCSMRSITA